MGRREYGQPCSLACALDRVGERWSLLVIRELLLGPLRFSELDRAVGGAPTDVLSKRLRDLGEAGIVRRRELDPPASASVYELTALGRELERPLLELGRWGLNFHDPATIAEMPPAMLPNARPRRPAPRPGRDADGRAAQRRPGLPAAGRERLDRGSPRRGGSGRCDPQRHPLAGDGDPVMGEDGELGAEVSGDRCGARGAAGDGRPAAGAARGRLRSSPPPAAT